MPDAEQPPTAKTFSARVLCEALESAFDMNSFQRFVSLRFGPEWWRQVQIDTFRDAVFDVVRISVRAGWTRQLVSAAKAEVPNNEKVRELDEEGDYTSPESPVPGDAGDEFRDAARRLHDALRNRQAGFSYLSANKSLHDVLHNLQKLQQRIAEVTERMVAGGQTPDAGNLVKVLRRYVADARKYAAVAVKARPPEDPTVWIGAFGAAVGVIDTAQGGVTPATAPDLGEAARFLANLPADVQGGLNREIYAHARGLNASELEDLIGQIPPAPDSRDGRELRARLDQFKPLCRDVTTLVADHNQCQDIDRDLSEVVGLGADCAPRKWERLRAGLDKLAERWDDSGQFGAAVARFDADLRAGAGEAVAESVGKLIDEFQCLFQAVDQRLREAANGLPVAALELQPLLEKWM